MLLINILNMLFCRAFNGFGNLYRHVDSDDHLLFCLVYFALFLLKIFCCYRLVEAPNGIQIHFMLGLYFVFLWKRFKKSHRNLRLIVLQAVTGSECIFAQELVGINAATQHCCFLGDMTKKVIIIPCLDEILKTGSHEQQK